MHIDPTDPKYDIFTQGDPTGVILQEFIGGKNPTNILIHKRHGKFLAELIRTDPRFVFDPCAAWLAGNTLTIGATNHGADWSLPVAATFGLHDGFWREGASIAAPAETVLFISLNFLGPKHMQVQYVTQHSDQRQRHGYKADWLLRHGRFKVSRVQRVTIFKVVKYLSSATDSDPSPG